MILVWESLVELLREFLQIASEQCIILDILMERGDEIEVGIVNQFTGSRVNNIGLVDFI
jgi:hypothetical protein